MFVDFEVKSLWAPCCECFVVTFFGFEPCVGSLFIVSRTHVCMLVGFSVTRKIAQYLGEVLEDTTPTRDKLLENLKINDGNEID